MEIQNDFTKFTNFDFKEKWTDVKPFLQDPDIIKAIERGIVGYLHNWKRSELKINKYRDLSHYQKCQKKQKHKYPAMYSSGDSFAMHCDELEEKLEEDGLDIDALFFKKYSEYGTIIDHEQYESNELFQDRYIKFREELLDPLVDELLVNDYKTHALYGSCFWYNLTFGLTLARKLYPEYNWECVSSSKHLTVVCFEQKMILDILYYGENKQGCGAVDALNDAYVDNDGLPIMEELCQYLF